jgi:hypothetical protein
VPSLIVGGLLGESERKNLFQMASNAVGVTYHRLHHFLTEAPWSSSQVNERRLQIMNKCSQTRISRGFSLIIDDSGHIKSVQKAEVRSSEVISEPTLKNVGLRLWTPCVLSHSPLDTNLFILVGFIPTTKVFIDTSFLLPSAFCPLPFFW